MSKKRSQKNKKSEIENAEIESSAAPEMNADSSLTGNESALAAIRRAAQGLDLFSETPAPSVPTEFIESEETLEVTEVEMSDVTADESAERIVEESDELADFEAVGIEVEPEAESFLPEDPSLEAADDNQESLPQVENVEGTELDSFESADIEEVEFVEEERLDSILESIFFASDRPVSLNSLKLVFKGTNIRTDKIRKSIDRLSIELASGTRGVSLEEVPGGYQLRTKVDNMQFLTRTLKARPFKLSGPALEVLAIVAYKQPVIKHEIDEIRGVESGHLLRALMEKGLVAFEGKSDLPGKPMNYATTKKFLEIFALRNLKELPTLSQIDELLPEGMTEEEAKPTLGQVSDSLAQSIGGSYSEGEEELMKISDQLDSIATSSDFFEQEKVRQRQKRDAEKAQGIRDALIMGEEVSNRDKNWLERYDLALQAGNSAEFSTAEAGENVPSAPEQNMNEDSMAVSELSFEEDSHPEDELSAYEVADISEDDDISDEKMSGGESSEEGNSEASV